MKKILIISILCLMVFLIYLSTIDRKVYYLVLGNKEEFDIASNVDNYSKSVEKYLRSKNVLEKSVENFVDNYDRITDLINKINQNKEVTINNKEISLKNALIKADLLTLSTGINELRNLFIYNSDNIYKHIDKLLNDYEELFITLRKYCKEDIILIGYHTSYKEYETYLNYLNDKLESLCKKYSIHYINTDIDTNISDIVIKKIEEVVFH